MKLTAWQEDVLKETFNIGVGKAAAALVSLVGPEAEVRLTVPTVCMVPLAHLARELDSEEGEETTSVSETFEGKVRGRAALLYSKRECLALVALLLGEDPTKLEFGEVEGDVLLEVGNIVLNAFLGTVDNTLDLCIEASVPEIRRGDWLDHLDEEGELEVLFVRVGFSMLNSEHSGHIDFCLDHEASAALIECVDQFTTRMNG